MIDDKIRAAGMGVRLDHDIDYDIANTVRLIATEADQRILREQWKFQRARAEQLEIDLAAERRAHTETRCALRGERLFWQAIFGAALVVGVLMWAVKRGYMS